MEVTTEAVRANLRISFGKDLWDYTVSRLSTEADAESLLLLAEAVSLLQGAEPLDLVSTKEYRLTQGH